MEELLATLPSVIGTYEKGARRGKAKNFSFKDDCYLLKRKPQKNGSQRYTISLINEVANDIIRTIGEETGQKLLEDGSILLYPNKDGDKIVRSSKEKDARYNIEIKKLGADYESKIKQGNSFRHIALSPKYYCDCVVLSPTGKED